VKRFLAILIFAALLLVAACDEVGDNMLQAELWRKAYAVLLMDYAEQPSLAQYGGVGWHFVLYDINKDDIPELIIMDSWNFKSVNSLFVYTFEDGEIVPLEAEYMGWQFFTRTDDKPGIVVDISTGYAAGMVTMAMYGHKLVAENKLVGRHDGELIQSYTITEENIHDIIFGWRPMEPVEIMETVEVSVSWRETYAALLWQYEEKGGDLRFFLHDFDGSGIPELMIAGNYADMIADEYTGGIYDAAYSFRDGLLIPLQFGEGVYIGGFALAGRGGVYPPRGSEPGLLTYIAGAGSPFGARGLYWWITLDDDRLIIDIHAERYVDFAEERLRWFVEDNEVTAQEFARIIGVEERIATHAITEANILDVLFGWQPRVPATWREVYQAVLSQYHAEGGNMRFFLHDIDSDGIPELIVAGDFDAVYTFRNGEMLSLEYGEGVRIADIINAFHAFRLWGYAAPNNDPGLIFMQYSPANGYFSIGELRYWRIVIDGDNLFIDAYGERFVDIDSLYGMRDELFNEYGVVIDFDTLWTAMGRYTRWYLNDNIVSQEEIHRVFAIGEQLWPLPITEENIQDVIFGWPYMVSWQEAYATLLWQHEEKGGALCWWKDCYRSTLTSSQG